MLRCSGLIRDIITGASSIGTQATKWGELERPGEIKALSTNKDDQAARIRFGTDGWRAVIGEDFNENNVNRVATGIARYLLDGPSADNNRVAPVLIGYDTRQMSAKMARLCGRVFAAHGLESAISVRPVTTPTVAEAVSRAGYSAGVVITASHNPYNFNGIKFKPWYGGSASEEITGRIEAGIPDLPTVPAGGRTAAKLMSRIDLLNGYLAYLGKHIDFTALSRFSGTVVLDSMYGASQEVGTLIIGLSHLKAREIHRFGRRDRTLAPEPIPPHTMALSKRVVQMYRKQRGEGRILGIALDGDGDRIGAVAEDGSFVNSHQIFALLLDYLAGDLGIRGRVLKTVSTSSLIDKISAHYGLDLEVNPVGFKYLCPGILEGGVVMAGEESGGLYLHGTVPERDGIMAGLKLIEMLSMRQMNLGEALNDLSSRFGRLHYGRKDLHLTDEGALLVRKHAQDWAPGTLGGLPVEDRIRIDGLKQVTAEGSWLMVRPSGTEPVVRIYAEAQSAEAVDQLLHEGISALPAGVSL